MKLSIVEIIYKRRLIYFSHIVRMTSWADPNRENQTNRTDTACLKMGLGGRQTC